LPTATEQAIKLTPDQTYANDFIRLQNDPAALTKLRYDQNAPEWVRTLASQKELQDLRHKDETVKVQQKIQTAIENNDGRTIANMISPRKKDTDEGSIAKAFLFSLIGFQSGAAAEVEKMGLKDKWDIARLGEADVTVKYNPRGEAKDAIYTSGPMAGQRVSDADLAMLNGEGAAGGKAKSDVSTQDVERNGVAGRVVTEHRNGRTQTFVESGGKRFAYDTTWQPRSIATAASKADYGLITDLRKKFGTNAIDAMSEYQKYKGPLDERSRAEFLNLYGFNAATPTGQTPAPVQLPNVNTPAPAPTAPNVPGTAQQNQGQANRPNMATPGAIQPVVPTQPVNAPAAAPATAPATNLTTPIAQLETNQQAQATGQKEITKKTGEIVAMSQDTRNLIKSIDKAETLLESGAHNVGSYLSGVVGRGPIAQAIGGQLETSDAKNTKLILDTVNKLATEGLKTLGSNPSTADLKFWTENKPNGATDPEVMKEWIKSRKGDLERRLEYANTQTQTGGTAGVAPPVAADETPADKARRELEKRRKAGGGI
jgi:hypothetical protein